MFFFETESYFIELAGVELAIYVQQALNFYQSPYFHLSMLRWRGTGITMSFYTFLWPKNTIGSNVLLLFSFFFFFFFWDRTVIYIPGWSRTSYIVLPDSNYRVLELKGVCHHSSQRSNFLNNKASKNAVQRKTTVSTLRLSFSQQVH